MGGVALDRICLNCLEAPTPWLDEPFCEACQLEKDLRGQPLYGKYPEPESYGFAGATLEDIDPEDISSGYYVATIGSGDQAYERDASGV